MSGLVSDRRTQNRETGAIRISRVSQNHPGNRAADVPSAAAVAASYPLPEVVALPSKSDNNARRFSSRRRAAGGVGVRLARRISLGS